MILLSFVVVLFPVQVETSLLKENENQPPSILMEIKTSLRTLLIFSPNATLKMCCNMSYLGAIAAIAPKKFRKNMLQKVLCY